MPRECMSGGDAQPPVAERVLVGRGRPTPRRQAVLYVLKILVAGWRGVRQEAWGAGHRRQRQGHRRGLQRPEAGC